MNEITIAEKLKQKTVLQQLGRLASHFPNSGHTKESMQVVAVDWFKEFKTIPDDGFVNLIDEVLRHTRFFPVIADIWAATKNVGLCDKCKYRNICDMKKKNEKDFGKTCGSCIIGNPQ